MNKIKKLVLIHILILGGVLMSGLNCGQEKNLVKKSMLNKLTAEEKKVIIGKGTERPFTGEYNKHKATGSYVCRQCSLPLYTSDSKFESNCGWPSFDDEIPGSVKRLTDRDGRRTEILCSYCDAHLGHVFEGEGFTSKNVRHCVNSISMDFVPADQPLKRARAFFAGGCFWGVEHLLESQEGVLDVRSGYMGGKMKDPGYEQVSAGRSGHAEAVEVIFNPQKISYQTLARLFFEIHDFTQLNRQGPDIGTQYRSEIFYVNNEQKKTVLKLIEILKKKGYNVKTGVTGASDFWPAEEYHQDYYRKTGKQPYCHRYQKIF